MPEKKHVILADDHQLLRMALSDKLKEICISSGVDAVVDVAENGSELVERVRSNGYCLAFTDMSMPVMNGIDAIKMIREKNKVIPVYLLTSHEGMNRVAREAGATGYVLKDDIELVNELMERAVEVHLKKGYGHQYQDEMIKAILGQKNP